MFDEQGSPRMYANILMSTDGSDVARRGVKHGIALAKALKAKATVITVTEPLPVDYGSGHASGWIPSQEEFDSLDGSGRDIRSTLAYSECAPRHRDSRSSKVWGLRLDRHGLSWASRPQEAVVGKSNIGGPRGRKRAGVGGAVADIDDSAGLGETGSCPWFNGEQGQKRRLLRYADHLTVRSHVERESDNTADDDLPIQPKVSPIGYTQRPKLGVVC